MLVWRCLGSYFSFWKYCLTLPLHIYRNAKQQIKGEIIMISGKTLDLWSQQYFISKYVDFVIMFFHSREDLMRFVLSSSMLSSFSCEWLVPHYTPFVITDTVLLHGIYVLFFYLLVELYIKQLLAILLCETSNFFICSWGIWFGQPQNMTYILFQITQLFTGLH